MKAFLAIDAGDPETALSALDAASAVETLEPKYPYSAAGVAKGMGDDEGATDRLERTLARQPNHALAANDLAWTLATDRNDLNRALKLAQLAVRRTPSAKTQTTLGWVHHRMGDYAKAIETYREALESDAVLPSTRYRLGLALAESGDVSEARRVFDELIQGPEFPELEAARMELERLQKS